MSSVQVDRPPRLIPGFEALPRQDDRRLSSIRPRPRFVRPISSLAILSTALATGSITTAIYVESERYCSYRPLATLRHTSKMRYIADMPSHSNLERIGSLASDQWGLITRRQAEQSGLSPATVARLSMTGGILKRVTHGVYLMAGAPVPEDLALRAAWLQLAPEVPVWERTAKDGVVSHRSAASLYRVGDLSADRHEFTLPERRQTRRRDVRLHTRPLSKSEWIALRRLPSRALHESRLISYTTRRIRKLSLESLRTLSVASSITPEPLPTVSLRTLHGSACDGATDARCSGGCWS